jgi:hypothetical protein
VNNPGNAFYSGLGLWRVTSQPAARCDARFVVMKDKSPGHRTDPMPLTSPRETASLLISYLEGAIIWVDYIETIV